MPYIGTKGEQLLRALKKKLLRCLNITNLQVKTRVSTTKLNFYTNAKDKVPKQNKSNIIYEFTYPISVAAATLARLTERFWNELKNMHTKTRKVLYTST